MLKSLDRVAAIAAAASVAGLVLWLLLGPPPKGPTVAVTPPGALSELAAGGKEPFGRFCARCHGENAGGTDQGPPLVYRIYEPSHHADLAFVRAARRGVRAHHWPYGDMPAVAGVSDDELGAIVRYVRELQRANGIF